MCEKSPSRKKALNATSKYVENQNREYFPKNALRLVMSPTWLFSQPITVGVYHSMPFM